MAKLSAGPMGVGDTTHLPNVSCGDLKHSQVYSVGQRTWDVDFRSIGASVAESFGSTKSWNHTSRLNPK
jgi:hypothetical protein